MKRQFFFFFLFILADFNYSKMVIRTRQSPANIYPRLSQMDGFSTFLEIMK